MQSIIVETSKKFKNPAKLAFTSKYRSKSWPLCNLKPCSDRGRYKIGPVTYYHSLIGLQIAFKFQRSFGDTVLELAIDFEDSLPKHCDKILNYTNKYCTISANAVDDETYFKESNIVEMFRLNPQIKALALHTCRDDFTKSTLKAAGIHLTSLSS